MSALTKAAKLIQENDALKAEIAALKAWIIECRDSLLFPLSHTANEIGMKAEGLGQQTVKLLQPED